MDGDLTLLSFSDRLFGLSPLGRLGESYRGWVWIPNCQIIHTFTLRLPIDLVWIDSSGKPIAFEFALPPRSIRRCAAAYGVRERYTSLAFQGFRD